jgi:radical SAM family uncharacterized protein/radical SAM-linked protein
MLRQDPNETVLALEAPIAANKVHPYSSFIHKVQKPARYLGGELYQVQKDHSEVDVTICLAFPDLYDLGMSHLGTKILYKVLNDNPRIACERAFAPWADMESELRARNLPVYSLESAVPLANFDVLGFSLQYEMTFTNVLTLLDLAGLELRAKNRSDDAPLILGGGPVATHPEAVSPFFDAFLIGDAEERLPEALLEYKRFRNAGANKQEALIQMAQNGGIYAPSLYTRALDTRSGLIVVDKPIDPRVPEVVERAFVEDINDYPFPDESPVAAAEAIFDRLSIEIARGCTEGCRFCQAGMIYRPVRERDPNEIVRTIVDAIEKGGYDEASLTALSTADYSCVDPLIRKVMKELRQRNVSLGVSSLRAYGLNEGLLDEIRSVRATGLTFAPEAGTQRMRDLVNKNVSEEDISASAHRIFRRGWDRMKLYFMIGLPLEEDIDVLGTVETGARMRSIGRQYVGKRAQVNVSVSSHVPKPHTPFQWAPMDNVEEIRRKQQLLRDRGRDLRVSVKYHDVRVSYLEGIMARGDVRVADVIELAWKNGCRFDGWDEGLRYDTWLDALASCEEVNPQLYLGTLPIDGRLPWDHIDVGLDDGFLAAEWKRASKYRLSPPCGKPKGELVHHTNLSDAATDERKLVCYHCGVACDLENMRVERQAFLESLGALNPPPPAAEPETQPQAKGRRAPPVREGQAKPEDMIRYRLQYSRTGLIRLQGHSDMLRILPRVFRRAQLPVGYSWGFHPKPLLSFTPALPLGTYSVGEALDISLTEPVPVDELIERVNAAADPGLHFSAGRVLHDKEKHVGTKLVSADYLIALQDVEPAEVANVARQTMMAKELVMEITRKKGTKKVNVRPSIEIARLADSSIWPKQIGILPDAPLLHLRLKLNMPAARPEELVKHLFGLEDKETPIVRLGFWREDKDGRTRSPLDSPPQDAPPTSPIAPNATTDGVAPV